MIHIEKIFCEDKDNRLFIVELRFRSLIFGI